MRPFAHYNCESIEQALSLVTEFKGEAKLMAGGTDLLGVLKDEILSASPKALVNIKTIPGLAKIEENQQGLSIGSLTKLSDLEKSDIVKAKYPLLADAAHSVASPEIRNMGTLGGNLCQDTRCWYYRYPHSMGGRIQCARKGKAPCFAVKGDNRYHSIFGGKKCFAVCPSDMALALSALDAELVIAGPNGQRSLKMDGLYDAMGTTLKKDEMIAQINVPKKFATWRQKFVKFRVRETIDFAIASVACALEMQQGICKQARIFLGGVAPSPVRAELSEAELIGKVITQETAQAAAGASVANAKPLRGNAYKVKLIKTLVQRTLAD